MTNTPAKTEFIAVRIAVLTVSDSRSLSDDRSGDTLVARLQAAGAYPSRARHFTR